MKEILTIASQYGALGLMLLASLWYINKRDQDHKTEREEMNLRFKEQHEEMLNVIKNNITVLTELKTIIKSNK